MLPKGLADLAALQDGVVTRRQALSAGLTAWHEALRAELERRVAHRWGVVLRDALDDIGAGSHSALEVRFVRDVVRAHGLPGPRLQRTTIAGVHDVGFDEHRVLVELDGLAFHADASARLSDTRRDRRSAGFGWLTLRVVCIDFSLHQCTTALDIATVLSLRG